MIKMAIKRDPVYNKSSSWCETCQQACYKLFGTTVTPEHWVVSFLLSYKQIFIEKSFITGTNSLLNIDPSYTTNSCGRGLTA